MPPRRLATGALWLMAAGVAAPAFSLSLAALLVSALVVGGTFMVVTMAGLQEARRITAGSPTRLVAGMTAAFAVARCSGRCSSQRGVAARAIVVPSVIAAALLVVSALAMQRG